VFFSSVIKASLSQQVCFIDSMESPSTEGFCQESLELASRILNMLSDAELVADIKSASD
jgi:hypothetical protein